MNGPRLLFALTALNVGVLLLGVAQHAGPSFAQQPASVLRARGLEIVDGQGRVRASLSVITEQGRPSVKISASEHASGLTVAGPSGTSDSYAILEAGAAGSSLRLRAESGREQVLRP